MPDSSRASRAATSARVGSPGSACPPKANHRRAFLCRLRSTRSPAPSITSAPAVMWSGYDERHMPSAVRPQVRDEPFAERLLPGVGRAPAAQGRQRVGVKGLS